jgi:UDP-3-O-acyl-N-acetylglucosamine deacetylase
MDIDAREVSHKTFFGTFLLEAHERQSQSIVNKFKVFPNSLASARTFSCFHAHDMFISRKLIASSSRNPIILLHIVSKFAFLSETGWNSKDESINEKLWVVRFHPPTKSLLSEGQKIGELLIFIIQASTRENART